MSWSGRIEIPANELQQPPTDTVNPYWPFFKMGILRHKSCKYQETFCKACLDGGSKKPIRGDMGTMARHLRKCNFFVGVVPPFPAHAKLKKLQPDRRLGHLIFRKDFEKKLLEKQPDIPDGFVKQLSACAYDRLSEDEKKKYDELHRQKVREKTAQLRANLGFSSGEEDDDNNDSSTTVNNGNVEDLFDVNYFHQVAAGKVKLTPEMTKYWEYFHRGKNNFQKSHAKAAYCKACWNATKTLEPVRAAASYMSKHLKACKYLTPEEKSKVLAPQEPTKVSQDGKRMGYVEFRVEHEKDYWEKFPDTSPEELKQISRNAYDALPESERERYDQEYRELSKGLSWRENRNRLRRVRQKFRWKLLAGEREKVKEDRSLIAKKKTEASKKKKTRKKKSALMDSNDSDDADSDSDEYQDSGSSLAQFSGLPQTGNDDFRYSISGGQPSPDLEQGSSSAISQSRGQCLRKRGYVEFRLEYEYDYWTEFPNTSKDELKRLSKEAYDALPESEQERYDQMYRERSERLSQQENRLRLRRARAKFRRRIQTAEKEKATGRKSSLSEQESQDKISGKRRPQKKKSAVVGSDNLSNTPSGSGGPQDAELEPELISKRVEKTNSSRRNEVPEATSSLKSLPRKRKKIKTEPDESPQQDFVMESYRKNGLRPCSVGGCGNWDTGFSEIIVYDFSGGDGTWVEFCRQPPSWKFKPGDGICSEHFTKSDNERMVEILGSGGDMFPGIHPTSNHLDVMEEISVAAEADTRKKIPIQRALKTVTTVRKRP